MATGSTAIEFFPTNYASLEANETPQDTFSPQPRGYIVERVDNQSTNTFGGEELPLWEELGIDPDLIKTKALSIILRRKLDDRLVKDEDLGGPFVFCILLGITLLFQGGKLHFGYIFGYSILGSLALYILLNLMTEQSIGLYHTMSVLGYCLIPMIFLALTSIIFPPTGIIGFLIAVSIIGFCTQSASLLFVKVLQTADQRYLFAYPIALLYACFALIVMF